MREASYKERENEHLRVIKKLKRILKKKLGEIAILDKEIAMRRKSVFLDVENTCVSQDEE